MIMEYKSQDLQLENWRPMREAVQVTSKSSSRLKTQQEPSVQFHSEAGKDQRPSSAVRQKFSYSAFFVLFRSLTDWMRSTHLRKGNRLSSLYQFKC